MGRGVEIVYAAIPGGDQHSLGRIGHGLEHVAEEGRHPSRADRQERSGTWFVH
jgi:hypothetical protein